MGECVSVTEDVSCLPHTRHVRQVLRDPSYDAATPRMKVDVALNLVRDAGEHWKVWGAGAAYTRHRTCLDAFLRYEFDRLAREAFGDTCSVCRVPFSSSDKLSIHAEEHFSRFLQFLLDTDGDDS